MAIFAQTSSTEIFERVHDQDIRKALERVCRSKAFEGKARANRFLNYIVEEALQGRADRIKAYSVALEVFGRDETFDAQNDPVVRIEAGRLRRMLEHYYLDEGKEVPIVISVPKGGYIPSFEQRDSGPATSIEAQPPAATSAQRKFSILSPSSLSFIAVAIVAAVGWISVDT